jgi:putative ABC transport system permease protein
LSDRWRRYLRFWGHNVDADIDDELQYHLDMRVQFFLDQGYSPRDARRAALDTFGDLDAVTHELRKHDHRKLRKARRADMLQDLASDLRFGIRQLRSTPRFTAAVVLVLALGIGANTAIFSAIDAAFFRPLPFPQPDRLVSVANVNLPFEMSVGRPQSSAMLADFRADSTVFAHVASYASGGLNLTGGAEPARVNITYVTDDFFATIGRVPSIGRQPSVEEFARNGPKVIVLSHGLWDRQFGGDRAVVGRTVALNGNPYTVVGIMPADFAFPAGAELWIPLALPHGFDIMAAFRNFLPARGIARLAPGVTPAQAAQHADALRRRFRKIDANDTPAAKLVEPLQTTLVGDRRTALLILAASAALLLLIACANVTNLLLARAATRQREIAVRVVLGATRLRIIRQLTVESAVLALAGAIAATVVARLGVRGLAAALPPSLAGVAPPSIDGRVLLFTLAVALTTSMLFGIWPAISASRSDLSEAMKSAGAGGGGTRRRSASARGLLVIAEVSLALMLLVGAGLMVESLRTLLRTDAGMHVEHVVTGRLVLPGSKFGSRDLEAAFIKSVVARLAAAPGVAAAAAVSALPMEGAGGISLRIAPADAPEDESRMASGAYLMATPGYFSVMGARLRGEDLPANNDTSRRVAVINETMAKRLWPTGDALGKLLQIGPELRMVIGVVGDMRTRRLDTAATSQMYFPMSEQPQVYASIVARGPGDPSALLARLRDAVRAVDPTQPVYALQSMSDVVAATVAPRRTNTILLTVFGALAVLLAAVGVYAVLSYGVAQRTREIGVRVALGAQRGDVVGLIVREGAALSAVGILIGLAGALALSRFIGSILYQVSPHDVRVFLAAPVLLGVVAVAATLLPALRATRVDPLTALREE